MPPKRAKASVFDDKTRHSRCGQCEEEIAEHVDPCIMCDECSRWFHGACVSLSSEDIRVLGRISNCRWFCDSCLPQTKAVEELAKQTRKLSSNANDLQTSITKNPPFELSAKKGIQNVEKLSPSKKIDEYQYEVRVSGIPENNEASRIKRQFKDEEEVENVCSSIGYTYPIKECRRIGKFVDGRTRKLIVTFNSVWDARALVAKASEKELYKNSRVLITPGLSEADVRKEQVVLKKRWELMNSGIRTEDLRIHKFRLYQSTLRARWRWSLIDNQLSANYHWNYFT